MKDTGATTPGPGSGSRARGLGFWVLFSLCLSAFVVTLVLRVSTVSAGGAGRTPTAARSVEPASAARSYEDLYQDYLPDFVNRDAQRWAPRGRDEPLKLSYQKDFFNMAVVLEDSRVDALIAFGRKREADVEFRDAMAAYRKVLEEYPDVLYRVAEQGIFVPARQYVHRRLLAFPQKELEFYRTLYDAPARDAFERARRRYSLLDLREVADSMLATSYGARALFELGNAALDIGNFEEALGYYERVRHEFPDSYAASGPIDAVHLSLKIAYCQKALGRPPAPLNITSLSEAPPPAAGKDLSRLTPAERRGLEAAVASRQVARPSALVQSATPPEDSVADYRLFPPTDDPIGLKPAVWTIPLPVSHRDWSVFFYPVATKDSLIYRHKNIVYCRSLISGALRWTNDLGGRVVWQNYVDVPRFV